MWPHTGAFGLFNHPLAWTLFFGLAPLAAFPPLEWHLTAWVAFAPLLLALCAHQGSLKQWFWMGWGLGTVFFTGQFFWLHQALVELAGMAVIPFVVFFSLLVGALGLYFAAGCLLVRWCRQALGWHPFWTFPAWLAVQDWLLSQFPFGGIAWGSLAATQPHTLAARWTVPFIGAPGLILLMGAINACWAWSLLSALPAEGGISGGRGLRLPRARRLAGQGCMVRVTVMLSWSLPAGRIQADARRMTV